MEFDADLHLHGLHAGGVSNQMTIPVIAEQATLKGLDLVGTGDCLLPAWRNHIREETQGIDHGVLHTASGTRFLLTCEVEDTHRIHHLLLFPSFEAVEAVYDEFASFSTDIDREGRPRLNLTGQDIAQVCERHDVLIGPAHAFTPWTAIYKEFDALAECYGNSTDYVAFLELGLSADSAFADSIADHHDLIYVSFSDAHSPWPHRLGREFTRFQANAITFQEVEHALLRHNGRCTTLNVGLDPREGKYHCTACINCYQSYTLTQAQEYGWRCAECGKQVKKGVKDRIGELGDADTAPDHRPPYLHVFPLPEIIQKVVGHASPTTKTVQKIYDKFQQQFPSEAAMLTDISVASLAAVNPAVAQAIKGFREEQTIIVPGGGGQYGELVIPADAAERQRIRDQRKDELSCRYSKTQARLDTY